MASTRNNNTPGNYCLQQNSYAQSLARNSYVGAAKPAQSAIPCFGITPSHMPASVLSQNPVDIESSLRGTGSVNLVDPQPKITPELNQLPGVAFFTTTPVFMPKPLVIEGNQRPFPV